MNRYERQVEEQRRASLRNSLLLWSTAGILLVVALAILGYSGHASQGFWSTAAIIVAAFLLVIRMVGRRLRKGTAKTVKPDEQSMLHLD